MIKINVEIVREELGGVGEVEKKKSFQIPLLWLNSFRRRRRKPEQEPGEAVSIQKVEEEDERPEGWIHPPLP